MNKERFHNEIALRLGYERIVKDKRVAIAILDGDDPLVTLRIQGCDDEIRFKASEAANVASSKDRQDIQHEIKEIIEAFHQAYIESTKEPFVCYQIK